MWPLLGVEAALATALAATPWLRAYHIEGAAPLLAGAAAVSVAAPALVAVGWRQPPVVSYSWSLAALIARATCSRPRCL
jgi:hypothetical protein